MYKKNLMTSVRQCVFTGMLLSSLFITSCNSNKTDTTDSDSTKMAKTDDGAEEKKLKPKGSKPEWAPTITDPMQVVIEKLMSYNAPQFQHYLHRKHASNHRLQLQ